MVHREVKMVSKFAATATVRTSALDLLPRTSANTEARLRERRDWPRFLSLLLVALLVVLAQGCASTPKRNPLPQDLYDSAQVAGISEIRTWGDEPAPVVARMFSMSREELRARFPAITEKPMTFLAVSGGGSDGAFSAGLLNGWSEAGTRPEFSMVTGVSTGALVAPFAFLGSAYDGQLEEVFLTISDKQVFKRRGMLATITGDAAADNAPLRATIARHIDAAMMEDIAEEHARGRVLFIGTTNLDSERPVVWNIGAIAASGAPGALDLIIDVMLASAAIPVAFPPSMFEVQAGGKKYDEMHVDGGVSRQSFLFALHTDGEALMQHLGAVGQTKVFVLRNAKLASAWKPVDRRIFAIADRSTASMIRTQGIGDLYREYVATIHFGFDYNLAFIPDSFTATPAPGTEFEPEYMKKLYQEGYDLARNGYPWTKRPRVR
jgi:predicted patatin/cPLA2 family phospholipase